MTTEAPAYTPEAGHLVRVQRWEVPCPEIPGTWERKLLVELDGTVESVRELAGGYLIKLAGDDADPIFTGRQFSGQDPDHGCSWSLVTEVTRRIGDEPANLDALTERRKADRLVMAQYVAELAAGHGLRAQVRRLETKRMVLAGLEGPHGLRLTVRFQGNTPHAAVDTYVLNWHMLPGETDGYRLNPRVFEAVNPYHGCKATEVANGYRELTEVLGNRFAHIQGGTAFVRAELPYRHTTEEYGRVSPRVAAAEDTTPHRPGWHS